MTRPPIKSARRRKPKLPNGHRAVMASRQRTKDDRDFYPTPPYATRALCHVVLPHLAIYGLQELSAWEPACGEGHMAQVLEDYFGEVRSTDLYDYDFGGRGIDFLNAKLSPPLVDWIITNPPYVKAAQFALRALDLAYSGVALFVRTQFLETVGRYEKLFRDNPPTLFAPFVERVPLCKGKWDPDGSTATAYCWLVWVKGREPMPPFWIPPGQRKLLTRPDDRERFAAWSMPQREAAE